MADTAAHLVDHVLPVAPYRLWTLSLPRSIRVRVVREPSLLTGVLSIFLRALFAYQRRRARELSIADPQTGAVSFIQLWGSVLQLTPHAHSWLPDGVFGKDESGALRFVRLPPPSDADVAALLARIARRVLALIDHDDVGSGADDDDAQLWAQAEASQPPLYCIPLGADELQRPRCAFAEGFSLHADLAAPADDRRQLERLLRYALRPPFAARRLSWTKDGKIRLKLRKPWHTGQRDIIFEPAPVSQAPRRRDPEAPTEPGPLPRRLRAKRRASIRAAGAGAAEPACAVTTRASRRRASRSAPCRARRRTARNAQPLPPPMG